MKIPFRHRYWLVKYFSSLEIRRARFNPCGAARSLAFWQAQGLDEEHNISEHFRKARRRLDERREES